MATFVLIPGAGGSAWYWHRVVAELAARGHDAVAVALPAGDPDADFVAYADACVGQLVASGHTPSSLTGDEVVVVAQSLGGFTAPVVAGRLDPRRVVLVNAMIPLPHETPGHWFTTSGAGTARAAAAAADGRPPAEGIDPMQDFFHDVPEAVVAEAMRPGEPEQSDGIMSCESPFDEWPTDVRVITGRDDRFFPADFQRRIARERLGVDVTVIPGGHLVALSQPTALADALT